MGNNNHRNDTGTGTRYQVGTSYLLPNNDDNNNNTNND